jgi:hypothetical protein
MKAWTGVFLVLYAASFSAAETGKISGTVVDEHGAPAANLMLELYPIGVAIIGALPRIKTDAHGQFVIIVPSSNRDPEGPSHNMRWLIYPRQGYYPDLSSRFYTTNVNRAQVVEFTPDISEATVKLKLGPKAGALKGHVTDTLTGAPVNPYFELAWASDPQNRMGIGTHSSYFILLPANTHITLWVQSPGYKRWTYPGTVNIRPGHNMTLDVKLEPVRYQHEVVIH